MRIFIILSFVASVISPLLTTHAAKPSSTNVQNSQLQMQNAIRNQIEFQLIDILQNASIKRQEIAGLIKRMSLAESNQLTAKKFGLTGRVRQLETERLSLANSLNQAKIDLDEYNKQQIQIRKSLNK